MVDWHTVHDVWMQLSTTASASVSLPGPVCFLKNKLVFDATCIDLAVFSVLDSMSIGCLSVQCGICLVEFVWP